MNTDISEYNFLRWSAIQKLASNEISKVIGLIPLAGYLILFNDSLADAIGFDQIAGRAANENSPFLLESTTKLRMVFFGSISLFLGALLFRARSPKEIEMAQSELQFSDVVLNSYSKKEIIQIEEQILSGTWKMRTDRVLEAVAGDSGNPIEQIKLADLKPRVARFNNDSFLRGKGGQYVRALAREFWLFREYSRPKTRIAVLVACLAGYGLLALPTIDIAQAVLMDILRSMFFVADGR